MALLDSELTRIRAELGFATLDVGAEPMISIVSVFDQVIGPHMSSGASTTSSTVVDAAASPTPVTLTLASAAGFAAFDVVAVDVDARQEIATVQSVSGSDITLLLQKAHGPGAYPVTVSSGETSVRQCLRQLQLIADELGGAGSGVQAAGLRRVDEIEFHASAQGAGRFAELAAARQYWRGELAKLCGVYEWWSSRHAGGGMSGGSVALY